MKKFFEEFKAFALKGNVMDMAIGVIIGAAFGDIVTALTECFIQPIIALIGGAEVHGTIPLGNSGQALDYGSFLTAVINFIIMALILFCIVKAMNKLMTLGKKEEETAPLTRICPYCKSEISIEATRCAHCTSELPTE
ncbi:MAG: large conductance mechanosensitive channel protein MscL [Lachnospiraceae bacterium]|nr:large conductance mechanosensitive channel protein MscL [Lachnospiraceae bacterium]